MVICPGHPLCVFGQSVLIKGFFYCRRNIVSFDFQKAATVNDLVVAFSYYTEDVKLIGLSYDLAKDPLPSRKVIIYGLTREDIIVMKHMVIETYPAYEERTANSLCMTGQPDPISESGRPRLINIRYITAISKEAICFLVNMHFEPPSTIISVSGSAVTSFSHMSSTSGTFLL